MNKENKSNDNSKRIAKVVVITIILAVIAAFAIPWLQAENAKVKENEDAKISELFSDKYKEVSKTEPVKGVSADYTNKDREYYYYQGLFTRPLYKVNSKFVICDPDTKEIYKASKSDIEKYRKENAKDLDTQWSLNKIIQSAYKIGANLTANTHGSEFEDLEWQFNFPLDKGKRWYTLSAFKDVFTYDQSNDRFYDNFLEESGLKLKEENVVIDQVVVSYDWLFTFVFNADITTEKKPAIYNYEDWIPEEGKTANVTFALTTWPINDQIDISDIDVVSYKMLNE